MWCQTKHVRFNKVQKKCWGNLKEILLKFIGNLGVKFQNNFKQNLKKIKVTNYGDFEQNFNKTWKKFWDKFDLIILEKYLGNFW